MKSITKNEIEVLKLIFFPDKEIAKRLYLSESSVKYRLRSISDKLHFAESKTQILIYALRDKVISLDDIVIK